MTSLVSTAWLADRLGDPGLVVLDATYVAVPADPPRDEAVEHAAAHIPGARFLDLRALSGGQATSLPAAEKVAARLGAIGIRPDDRIVLYDDSPHRTSRGAGGCCAASHPRCRSRSSTAGWPNGDARGGR